MSYSFRALTKPSLVYLVLGHIYLVHFVFSSHVFIFGEAGGRKDTKTERENVAE